AGRALGCGRRGGWGLGYAAPKHRSRARRGWPRVAGFGLLFGAVVFAFGLRGARRLRFHQRVGRTGFRHLERREHRVKTRGGTERGVPEIRLRRGGNPREGENKNDEGK